MRALVLGVMGMTLGTAAAEPRLGIQADVGVPDGAVGSVVVRPVRAVRLHAGVGHNAISRGLRTGLTLVPLRSWLSPTLSVDVGRYEEGDATPLARRLSGDADYTNPTLERVGYTYANAHLGLELGRRWFTFYLHAGASRVTGNVYELVPMSETSSVSFSQEPRATAWSVSARLGFIVYLVR